MAVGEAAGAMAGAMTVAAKMVELVDSAVTVVGQSEATVEVAAVAERKPRTS